MTIRYWQRPQVKAGGVYRVGDGSICIDSIELIPFAGITRDDLNRSGESDLEALRTRAAHSGPIRDDTLVYRIEFHTV